MTGKPPCTAPRAGFPGGPLGRGPHPAPPEAELPLIASCWTSPIPKEGHGGWGQAERRRCRQLPAPSASPPHLALPGPAGLSSTDRKSLCHFPGDDETSSGAASAAPGWDQPTWGHTSAWAQPQLDPQGHSTRQWNSKWPKAGSGWKQPQRPRMGAHRDPCDMEAPAHVSGARAAWFALGCGLFLPCTVPITPALEPPGTRLHPGLASAPVSQALGGGAQPCHAGGTGMGTPAPCSTGVLRGAGRC